MAKGTTARLHASRKAKLKRRFLQAAGDMKKVVRRKQKIRLKKGK